MFLRLIAAIVSVSLLAAGTPVLAKLEPWAQIEARTKFLRTDHYIQVVRVHTDVYDSARAKDGKRDKSPFPVHVILPASYDTDMNRRYGVVYLLGGKSGWDNGPEKGGATYWSVWCKTPLTLDNLKSGVLTKTSFQDNISDKELEMFNNWLAEDPFEELIVVSLWNPGGSNTGRYEKYLIDEVIPFIDSHYRTVPHRLFRGIDGACAGAAQAIMISAKHPDIFAYCGGQQTDLGSYPGTGNIWGRYVRSIQEAGGIAYNINTNVRDGCNSYSNQGRLYHLVQDMKRAGFPVTVNVFESCPHGYCAYRYPNGHQALYWFSKHFKKNARRFGINEGLPESSRNASAGGSDSDGTSIDIGLLAAQRTIGPLPGLW